MPCVFLDVLLFLMVAGVPGSLVGYLRAVTGSRMNCRVTTVEGSPEALASIPTDRFFNAH